MEMQLLPILYGAALAILAGTSYQWRKAAQLWEKQAKELEAFINDPNVKLREKQLEYKDTYEAQVNALSEERRQIDVAMNEVFDVLNEYALVLSEPRLMQCRNILLKAISVSTYGRG